MSDLVTIAGLDKAAVLATLYNASQPVGLGLLHPRANTDMTVGQAAVILAAHPDHLYFDYLQGRVMKVDISGDAIDPHNYDRDHYPGACAAAIKTLR